MFEIATSETKFGRPRCKTCGLDMCLNFEELGSRLSSFLLFFFFFFGGGIINVHFQLQSKTTVCKA
jgi:hypothetical protein